MHTPTHTLDRKKKICFLKKRKKFRCCWDKWHGRIEANGKSKTDKIKLSFFLVLVLETSWRED